MLNQKSKIVSVGIIAGLYFFVVVSAVGAFKMPTCFLENQGQMQASEVAYYFQSQHLDVFLTDSGEVVYQLPVDPRFGVSGFWNIQERFLDSKCRKMMGNDPLDACFNFFIESVRRTDVPGYRQILFENIYPGISVSFVASDSTVEKVFTIDPGADPARIRCEVDGASGMRILDTGELEISTDAGHLRFSAPSAYQVTESGVRHVPVSYVTDGMKYGFSVGDYDPGRPLVIDPLLASTCFGGTGSGWAEILDFALGDDGIVYVVGSTNRQNFPTTPGAYDSTVEDDDAFVAEFDEALETLLCATVIGGSRKERGIRIAIDGQGGVYIGGTTYSGDFPVTGGAYDTTYGGNSSRDCFISRFNKSLTQLEISTYFGGNDLEIMYCMAINNGNIYFGGETCSDDFPISPGAFDDTLDPGNDGFLAALDSNLSSLVGSSYVGGDHSRVYDIAFYQGNRLFITGFTMDEAFPFTEGAYQTEFAGESDAFICEVSPAITEIISATALGGNKSDNGFEIEIYKDQGIVVTGITDSSDFPVSEDAFISENPNYDRIFFISKLDFSLKHLLRSTYFGGIDESLLEPDFGGLLVDPEGDIYLGISIDSSTFPITKGAFMEEKQGDIDVYLARFDADLTKVKYATYLGGQFDDLLFSMKFDKSGNICLAGQTYGYFPTTESAYAPSTGDITGFVSKLDPMFLVDELTFLMEAPVTDVYPGDEYYLHVVFANPDEDYEDIPVFVLLGYGEEFWFWPSWVKYPPDYDFELMDIPHGIKEFYAIDPFIWPEVDVSDMAFVFYGALVSPDFSGLMTDVATVELRIP